MRCCRLRPDHDGVQLLIPEPLRGVLGGRMQFRARQKLQSSRYPMLLKGDGQRFAQDVTALRLQHPRRGVQEYSNSWP